MPKIVDAEVQRRAIASAAITVIDAAGLDGARLRDVARAARVTTGAVTHYFDDKDAVLEAALAEIVRRIHARQARAIAGPLGVTAFIAEACAYLPTDDPSRAEWRVWLAFWGRAIADERLRAQHRAYYAAIVDRLTDRLQRIARPTRPSRRAAAGCADALIAAIDGVGTRATLEPEAWPARRQRAVLTQLITPLLTAFAAAP